MFKRVLQVAPDDSVITAVPVPSTDGINYHSTKPYSNFMVPTVSGTAEVRSDAAFFNLNSVPVRMRVTDVATNFVHVRTSASKS